MKKIQKKYLFIGIVFLTILLCCGCAQSGADTGDGETLSTNPVLESAPSTIPTEPSVPATEPAEEIFPAIAPTESVRDGITIRDSTMLAESIYLPPVMEFALSGVYRGVAFHFLLPVEYDDLEIRIDAIGGTLYPPGRGMREFIPSVTLTHSLSTPIASYTKEPRTTVNHYVQFHPGEPYKTFGEEGYVRILFFRGESVFGAAVFKSTCITHRYDYYSQMLGAVEFISEDGPVPESVALAWIQEKIEDASIQYPNYIRPQDLEEVQWHQNWKP